MLLSVLILAFLGLVNEFVLDGALTDWVSKNAEVNWHWGIWIMVWLLYVIGDKILKRISSNGENVLNKLNEINVNLERNADSLDRLGDRLDRLGDQMLVAAEIPISSKDNHEP